jgi:3-oxoacyl-[acyl-carrier protein] reductase
VPVTSLTGRTALVTGATGTLGRAVAEEFLRSGARVVLSARRESALQELASSFAARHRGDVSPIPCDLARPDDVRRLAADGCRQFGGLDILVNAAAELGPIGPLWEVDWVEWTRAIDVNLHAVVQLCALCIPHMPLTGARGKIVNVSGGGATSPRPRFSSYAAAKAALVRFSETLAQETAGRSIDVNCIAPGVLDSGLARAVLNAGVDRAGRQEYEAAEQAVRARADGQRAAALCTFLASEASDGITGKLISAQWDPWESLSRHRADLDATDVYTLRRILPRDRGFTWGTS